MATFLQIIVLVAVCYSSALSLELYGPWGEWSSCSTSPPGGCGEGLRWRFRDCYELFVFLCDNNVQQEKCKVSCQVDGQWSAWSPWGDCSVTCGGGSQSRSRTCTDPAPANGGRYCTGKDKESHPCAMTTCPSLCKVGDVIYDKCGQRCVCSSSGELTQCTRIRKEFTTMTTAERKRYVKIIKTVSTDLRYKSRYDSLLTTHKEIFNSSIHERYHFLAWHRWFMLKYENLLREVDCNFTIAYWDWSIVSGKPWETDADDVWYGGDSGLGGDGVAPLSCVNTGPFRQGRWELIPSAAPPLCLKRRFNGVPPDSIAVALVLDIPPINFTDFEVGLRLLLHNSVHCRISGTMCTNDSASAPEFFLHHGFVDKIWEDWQNKSTAHRNVFFLGFESPLPRTDGLLPRDFIHNTALPGGVRVQYQEVKKPVVATVVARLRTMKPQALKKIPREVFSFIGKDAINLFNTSARELALAKKIYARLLPIQRSHPPKQAEKMDKKLGFDHKMISSKKERKSE